MRASRSMFIGALLAVLAAPAGATRQASPTSQGASVRGRVVAADTGQPVRRISVTLTRAESADEPGSPSRAAAAKPPHVTATTSDEGRFEFTGLPAGDYRLAADPGLQHAQYLKASYGQSRPTGGGLPFALGTGQTFEAEIVLPRAGVIAGRVTDEDGEPLGRAPVFVLFFSPGARTGVGVGGDRDTDDRGQFRIFGLPPGDYAVASPGRQHDDSSDTADDFLLTYYPGAASPAEAQRIRVDTGSEIGGIDIRVLRGHLYKISGVVVDSQGRPAPEVVGTVQRTVGIGPLVSSFGTDRNGRFVAGAIPAGTYRVTVRPFNGRRDLPEFGSLDLAVASDLTDVTIGMRPGLTIAGRVVVADGIPVLSAAPAMRVMAAPAGQDRDGGPGDATAAVSPDGTFALGPVFGPVVVTAGHLPNGLAVQRVALDDTDITDRPHAFSRRDSGSLQIVLTRRPSAIEGAVGDGHGGPAVDCTVVLLLADPDARHATGETVYRRVSPDSRGQYRIADLHAGRYLVAAVPSDRLPGGDDELAASAVPVTVGEGERATVNLTIAPGGG